MPSIQGNLADSKGTHSRYDHVCPSPSATTTITTTIISPEMTLTINGLTLGFYPDEGDAGGRKSYLSDLNAALSRSWSPSSSIPAPRITVVGWYAQTYPHETFNGFQLMPLVDDIRHQYLTQPAAFIYEASVMPFQSWTGYTASNNTKALEVAQVMQAMLERSRITGGDLTIAEIRLRFGHEVNYYIRSGLYPPATNAGDEGGDYVQAFEQVALAVRSLPTQYAQRIKLFWCPNIASVPGPGADQEYSTFLPSLQYVDYVGIDYYCPAPGCLTSSDFVRKMRRVHDKYACETRPFIVGETGLHFDLPGSEQEDEAKLRWLQVVTSKEVRGALRWMVGVNWFNYEKDRDYRLVCVGEGEEGRNAGLVRFLGGGEEREMKGEGKKFKRFVKTLFG